MSDVQKGLVVLAVYFVVLISVGLLAYEMGEYNGMKTLCSSGKLNLYPDGEIKCDLLSNDTTELKLEVNYYGDYKA